MSPYGKQPSRLSDWISFEEAVITSTSKQNPTNNTNTSVPRPAGPGECPVATVESRTVLAHRRSGLVCALPSDFGCPARRTLIPQSRPRPRLPSRPTTRLSSTDGQRCLTVQIRFLVLTTHSMRVLHSPAPSLLLPLSRALLNQPRTARGEISTPFLQDTVATRFLLPPHPRWR